MTALEKERELAYKQEKTLLLDILLKKANVTRKELNEFLTQEWVVNHIKLLSSSEKKQFKSLVMK
jgi:hypothetical protein